MTSMKQNYFLVLRQIFDSFQFESIENETDRLLDAGVSPKSILMECQSIMKEIGEKFERKEYFLPELVAAGDLFKSASERIKRRHSTEGMDIVGQIVLGTPKGDIHNLGKDIFGVLAEASGFKVHDLGVDVTADAYLEKIEKTGAAFLGMSSLLTTNIKSMEEIINLLVKRGLRETTRVIIGGGATTRDLAEKIGADHQTWDAYEGVKILQAQSGLALPEVV